MCGIASPITSFTLITLAIRLSPWFSWTNDYLSDLGIRGDASTLFNSSLIANGALFAAFALGIRTSFLHDQPVGRFGALVFIADACALCATGIFPATYGDLHVFAAGLFFILIPVSLLLIGAEVLASSKKILGWFILIAAVSTTAIELFPWKWRGGAIPEALALLPMATCFVALGFRLLIKPEWEATTDTIRVTSA